MTLRMRPNTIVGVAYAAALLIVLVAAPVLAEQGLPENLVLHKIPKPVTSIEFADERGQTRSLADFRGKVVVLNIWATWCVPCRREMPMLDRLQAALGGPDFEVVPVSIDRGGIDTVPKFFGEIGVHNLAMYVDTAGQTLREVGAIGLPTTLIVSRNGLELGRIVGPAEWDSAEIMQLLRPIITQRTETISSIVPSDQAQTANTNKDARGALQRGLQWLKGLVGK